MWRGAIPVWVPDRKAVSEQIRLVFDVLGDLRPTEVLWVHSRMIGGSTTFAMEIAKSISRQSSKSTVLLVETGLHSNKQVTLESVGHGVYVLNPITKDRHQEVAQDLKFWLELAIQLEAKSHTCISSEVFFELLTIYGETLKLRSRLGAMFFCPDKDASGNDRGLSVTFFPDIAESLDFILTDNQKHVPDLIRQFNLPERISQKVHYLFFPVKVGETPLVSQPLAGERLRVLWVGRFSHQKGMDELVEIAGRLESIDFVVLGGTKAQFPIRPVPKNIRFEGVFNDMPSIAKFRGHLYLNTSHWEGRPITMLGFLAARTPVVSSASGGLMEMLSQPDSTGLLIEDSKDVDAFVKQLKTFDLERGLLAKLGQGTNLTLISQHSPERFDQQVLAALEIN
jgi:glycosyltransferase involved in cell wall biosynthesis